MHAIKKAARQSAWYQDENEKTLIPNPFGRSRYRRKPISDEEHALNRSISENDARSPVEQKRHSGYAETQRDFHGPNKAGTFPETSKHGLQVPIIEGSDSISRASTTKAEPIATQSQPQENGFTEKSVGVDTGSRKPKRRKFMPWKKDDVEDNSDDTRTNDSDAAKKNQPQITVQSQIRVVLFSWINILLLAVPVGIALGNIKGMNGVVIFVVNFIAIIPLAGMLSFATEELAMYIGETLGGLLNATFGNAVELIVGVIALVKKEILIVQTSLIGSMLSNLLLVLGMCFFFGGLRRTEQFFNLTVAQTGASLLALAIGSLVIPTAFDKFGSPNGIAEVSRGTSILLLVTYAAYLIFQLRTHVDMYNEPSQKTEKKPPSQSTVRMKNKLRSLSTKGGDKASVSSEKNGASSEKPPREREGSQSDDEADDGGETPQLTKYGALVTLAGSTVLVALCAEYMVDGIKAVSASVSQEFIGLILLPIVGNAAEHATAVTVAIKDKMDLAIGVAIGSSLQIALLVLPLMVLLNWFGVGGGSHPPMTLNFDGFLVIVLFISIILVNYVIQDGKSHWLEGALLQVTYLIIAVSAWFYPAKGNVAG